MLRGVWCVTEVVRGVTVTMFVSDSSVGSCHWAWSLPPDDNLASDWLLSLHLWLTLSSTRPLIGPLSLDLVTLVKTKNTLMLGYICGQRSASSVWNVMVGYVLYQIRLLPSPRVISHNILITIVNL